MLTDFQFFFTFDLSSDRVTHWSLWIPSHLKRVAIHFVKCKCQETTDNLKQMARLTIKFNLLQLIMFWLIYVTVNIQNVPLLLECRHGDVCATDQCHRQ